MNRRNFLTAGAPASGRDGAVRMNGGAAQTPPAFARRSSTGLEPYSGPWTYTQAAHLLRRCMVGPTDAEIRRAVTEGMDATVTKLMQGFTPDLALISDWAGKPDVQTGPSGSITDPDYAQKLQAFQTTLFERQGNIVRWWYRTMVNSPVSIQERMVLFWHNHFVSEMQTVNFPELMYVQNQLFRANMLGNFKKLVKDVTIDMAMLIYLDGAKNFKRTNRSNINENYSRELQELFTVGVVDWDGNPNYTQQDVSEAARALSGWTVTPSTMGSNYVKTTSQFVQLLWDNGNKTFLGQTGAWKMDDIVEIIFAQRAEQVGKFMCGKLYRAFVYNVMDPVVVADMASTFRNGNWELRPVMEQLLKSAHFYDETNIGAMEKSPMDYMVGMVRAMGLGAVPDLNTQVTGRGANELAGRCSSLGMQLFDPPNVKGWEGGRTWVSTSTLPTRQKFGIDVANGVIKRNNVTLYTLDALAFGKLFPNVDDIHKLADEMALFLLNTAPSDKEKTLLFNTLLDGGVDYEWDINDPDQNPGNRIKKFLVALFQLAKYQLY